jgi:hypothetical protein
MECLKISRGFFMIDMFDFFGGQFSFNKALAAEFMKNDSPLLKFLRTDLTQINSPSQFGATIEERLGLQLSSLDLHKYAKASSSSPFASSITDTEEATKHMLQTFGIDPTNLTIEAYLDKAEPIIQGLGFPYIRFPTEKVLAYFNVSEDQNKAFASAQKYNLALGNLGERAMQEILLQYGKEFIGRSFLLHNSDSPQDEKDIRVFMVKSDGDDLDPSFEKAESSLGVVCSRQFTGRYLYSPERVRDQTKQGKIADHIAFFNHLGHHIVYLVGIVKRDFLFKDNYEPYKKGQREAYIFPESTYTVHDRLEFIKHYSKTPLLGVDPSKDLLECVSDENKEAIVAKLKKRISFESYMESLLSRRL